MKKWLYYTVSILFLVGSRALIDFMILGQTISILSFFRYLMSAVIGTSLVVYVVLINKPMVNKIKKRLCYVVAILISIVCGSLVEVMMIGKAVAIPSFFCYLMSGVITLSFAGYVIYITKRKKA